MIIDLLRLFFVVLRSEEDHMLQLVENGGKAVLQMSFQELGDHRLLLLNLNLDLSSE